MSNSTQMPIGAEMIAPDKVRFRVWSPLAKTVEVLLQSRSDFEAKREPRVVALAAESGGYFSGEANAAVGDLYLFRLDKKADAFPDPASRFQPFGVGQPSQIIDPNAYRWNDRDWRGVSIDGQVIYEMHIGTFTREGTWEAASRQLDELARLGIGVIEVMPVADFAGRFNWGYDGVQLFAPARVYGTPDDFRHFVDRAHSLGLGVFLDVVYNHFGPEGCYVNEFSDDYCTRRYENDWGVAPNFDDKNNGPVREFFLANVAYWIREFHLDGFRVDALHTMNDSSKTHIVKQMTEAARAAASGRKIIMLAEFQPPRPEPGQTVLANPVDAADFDALWNEDFHHSAKVALTGSRQAYFSDYRGTPQELISAVKRGYLFQGQYAQWIEERRGIWTANFAPKALVNFLENHDQVANTGFGLRVHQRTSPALFRAMTALLLLAPQTPMLFQGQEFAASSPFMFFADPSAIFADGVRKGRAQFLSEFPSLALATTQAHFPDPTSPQTFERCKLDFSEREKNRAVYQLHRDLLRLRREDKVFSQQTKNIDGAVLGEHALVLRFFADDGDDRLLLLNTGREVFLHAVPEPLLAPPPGKCWRVLWTSEGVDYGGAGMPEPEADDGWQIHAQAAVVLALADEPVKPQGDRAATS